tara:strand:- start:1820 stop:2491 length:672 start_codon:yes stop_codon:yes gene_type:complete
MNKILICDDDKSITDSLAEYLESEEFVVSIANDGDVALESFSKFNPDIVLLDIMMPKFNGISILRSIRKKSEVPIIFLTAKIEEEDKILGLDLGADDYITKPFSARELTSRINSVLRRSTHRNNKEKLNSGNTNLFPLKREVIIDNNILDLTKTEFNLLEIFLKNPGIALSREKIINLIGSDYIESDDNTVTVHIKNLRKKLKNVNSSIKISTVHGFGYKLKG